MVDFNAKFYGENPLGVEFLDFNQRIGYIDGFREFISGTGTTYYVVAQDDGYAANQYFYWFDFDAGTGSAPPPLGNYYNLAVLGTAPYSDGFVIIQFTDTREPLYETLYRLRAEDSGKIAPGFTYWADNEVNLDNAPTPIGTYSNLTVLSAIQVRA